MKTPKIHYFPVRNIFPGIENSKDYLRVALGDLMPSAQRKALTPFGPAAERHMTGTIGFMDLSIGRVVVPIDYNGSMDFSNRERRRVLTLHTIGVEPEYRGQGHGKHLMRLAEVISHKAGLDEIVITSIQATEPEDPSIRLFASCGYTCYDFVNAIKKLS